MAWRRHAATAAVVGGAAYVGYLAADSHLALTYLSTVDASRVGWGVVAALWPAAAPAALLLAAAAPWARAAGTAAGHALHSAAARIRPPEQVLGHRLARTQDVLASEAAYTTARSARVAAAAERWSREAARLRDEAPARRERDVRAVLRHAGSIRAAARSLPAALRRRSDVRARLAAAKARLERTGPPPRTTPRTRPRPGEREPPAPGA